MQGMEAVMIKARKNVDETPLMVPYSRFCFYVISTVVEYCADRIYSTEAGCLLPRLVQLYLQDTSVPLAVRQYATLTLPHFVTGLAKLDFARDRYVRRVLVADIFGKLWLQFSCQQVCRGRSASVASGRLCNLPQGLRFAAPDAHPLTFWPQCAQNHAGVTTSGSTNLDKQVDDRIRVFTRCLTHRPRIVGGLAEGDSAVPLRRFAFGQLFPQYLAGRALQHHPTCESARWLCLQLIERVQWSVLGVANDIGPAQTDLALVLRALLSCLGTGRGSPEGHYHALDTLARLLKTYRQTMFTARGQPDSARATDWAPWVSSSSWRRVRCFAPPAPVAGPGTLSTCPRSTVSTVPALPGGRVPGQHPGTAAFGCHAFGRCRADGPDWPPP